MSDRAAADRVLGLSAERLLQDWSAAHGRAVAYLEALGLEESAYEPLVIAAVERALTREAWEPAADAISETLRALQEVLVERAPVSAPVLERSGDEEGFLAWRAARLGDGLPVRDGVLRSMPALERGSMVPQKIERRFLRRLFRRPRRERDGADATPSMSSGAGPEADTGPGAASEARAESTPASARHRRRGIPWVEASRHRRLLLGLLVLLPSIVASGFMVNVLPGKGDNWLEALIVVLFGALFGWISIGFWTAFLGFVLLVRGGDRFSISHDAGESDPAAAARGIAPEARTAIVMPICEEPVARVFAGLRAIHASLERIGATEHFHFFVLSDSADPSTAAREEEAWAAWCAEVGGFDRIFYRRRKVRLKRKSGNVADFCRRFGRKYRYMIMLDADSVMSGESLVRLVRMMEARPEVGLVQTAPRAVDRHSLLARVQQFATSLYGPMFAAGLHYWQLGDAQYWGHNAIIRIAPFMQYCGLGRLPGKPPFGGEILSHDFVESALLGRGGWTVWLAYDIPGSYEEVPSTLLEEMGRDRRWCQGNLQHLRLLFSEGIFTAHRALFVNGVLSYVSALLWFAFLLFSTAEAIKQSLVEPDYFPNGPSLFPEWPVWRPDWAMALLAVTAVILFLPKLLAIALVAIGHRKGRMYGGVGRLTLSVLLEILLSSFLAPIRMVFHSRFVVTNILGRTVTWGTQGRDDAETSWRVALRQHGGDMLLASAWGGLLFWLNPDYFWWVLPILGALVVSVPLSVWTSRVSAGRLARKLGLFLTPEEVEEPIELRDLHEKEEIAAEAASTLHPAEATDGFVRAVVDPVHNALHRALLGARRSVHAAIRARRRELVDRALVLGLRGLDARERKALFRDGEAIDELHRRAWSLSSAEQADRWGRPGEAER